MGIKHPSGVAECPLEFKEKIIITVTLFGRKPSLANVEQVGEIGFETICPLLSLSSPNAFTAKGFLTCAAAL